MIKKSFVFLSVLLTALNLAAAEYIVTVSNNSGKTLEKFPVIFRLAELNSVIPEDHGAAGIVNSEGKSLPIQLDDLNSNGKIDGDDEAVFITDLAPGNNSFTFTLRPGKANASAAATRKPELAADNGIVKINQNRSKLQLRNISRKFNNQWGMIAGHFVLELNMDKSWKWKELPKSINVQMFSGDLRTVIRFTSVRENSDSGKQISSACDMQIFAGRDEVVNTLTITNISAGQPLQINRVNQGFYKTAPNGKLLPATDIFSGISAKGETVSGNLASGSYELRYRGQNFAVWMDLCRSNDSGIGWIPAALNHLDSSRLVYLPQMKSARLSWLYCPKNLILWPGKAIVFRDYLITHNGDSAKVKDFAAAAGSLKVTFAAKGN